MKKQKRNLRFTLLAAVSLDGRITRGKEEGSRWTSAEDQRWFQKKLDEFDTLVMGRKTFAALKHPLTPRNRVIFTHSRLFCCSQEYQNRRGKAIFFSGTRQKLFATLQERRWRRSAIVGGTSIYDRFLKRALVDEIYLTLEPVIFGRGKFLISGRFPALSRCRLLSVQKLNSNGTLLLHYQIN